MNLKQLEDVLSSACNTYACLVRAHEALSRVKVTKKVQTHLGGLMTTSESLKAQMNQGLLDTGRAIHELSDHWAFHLSCISGGLVRMQESKYVVEGIYRGLWPSERSGFMLMLLEGTQSKTVDLDFKPDEQRAVIYLAGSKARVKVAIPLEDMHPIVPHIRSYQAVLVPIQQSRRRSLTIGPI